MLKIKNISQKNALLLQYRRAFKYFQSKNYFDK